MGVFSRECSNCIYCSTLECDDLVERYCYAVGCKNNNGVEIEDNIITANRCAWFTNKNIEKIGDEYCISGKYSLLTPPINCSCCDLNALKRFVSDLNFGFVEIFKLEEKIEKMNYQLGFIDFFKEELPDVYRKMWKEYCDKEKLRVVVKQDGKKVDSYGNQLSKGEQQRKDGTYHYTYLDSNKKRKYIYAKTLTELREKVNKRRKS